jgi:hypothetical protein
MRLIFIPGFHEEAFNFDHLHPLLQGKKLFLNSWKVLPNRSRPELNAALFAKELIQQYGITSTDVVIGHSTGGWIALCIKQQVHCLIVQISSWTDKRKLTMPAINRLSFESIGASMVTKKTLSGQTFSSHFQRGIHPADKREQSKRGQSAQVDLQPCKGSTDRRAGSSSSRQKRPDRTLPGQAVLQSTGRSF